MTTRQRTNRQREQARRERVDRLLAAVPKVKRASRLFTDRAAQEAQRIAAGGQPR